ncbi:MAG: hypothetical protein SOU50_09795 [Oscillospiraceae bacterium]|nr:hypothetical protein [Oscillospiraceae bacterium]MDD7428795.1 hypothetical protein [Oscillospiraceae bacterium]MDY2848491.1 hypothetical protein [Oscillospiraceae bacterium]
MDNKLLSLADKKIEQMEHFNDITSKIIYEDIDGVGELIENRQEIITALDGISAEMRQYVSEQSIERQTAINKVLQSEDINNLTDELIELQGKIKIMTGLREEIKRNDKAAVDRLKMLRDEAYEGLKKSMKNKQTINYYAPNSGGNLSNGSKLNISK